MISNSLKGNGELDVTVYFRETEDYETFNAQCQLELPNLALSLPMALHGKAVQFASLLSYCSS